MYILRNAVYETKNVMSIRGEFTEPALQAVLRKLHKYIESEGAKKTGGIITAVRLLYLETKTMDTEVFVPIDRKIPSTEEFTHVPVFCLTNCVTARYKGSSYLMPNVYADLYHKTKRLGIEVRQPFYNVFKKESDILWSLNEIEVDIYAVIKDE